MNKSNQRKFRRLIRMINWYPPFLFSGIKVVDYADYFSSFKTRLKLTWYNRNLLGTAFGGSLYSMCDPFFMFIVLIQLGEEYIVWDKTASIEFVKPGKGTVYAEFKLSPEQISDIKEVVDREGKAVFEFPCEVKDGNGNLIAKLQKGVYVRRKDLVKP
ncbi:Acyl-coenzyme A thioesterase PaaI, contains HGG motif [Algoriphagus locisalis]|uniref:Acyl-coenzyme A thioesterase PaaI, contains HGG motif n=1 Tax=Algoriphagus locisalis TaxID=305507 RepID=A0A1I7BDH2_9BACT|nr:YiiD C-terminal domain-containing protein [Algoriphagus locisalis]SFT85250.1 Acyl-coenzyme A thioesterase PaaI, contains HGG motif [Algoriphagus locisalis]